MITLKIYNKVSDGDYVYKLCLCSLCGKVEVCTVGTDFYKRRNGLLKCSECMGRQAKVGMRV